MYKRKRAYRTECDEVAELFLLRQCGIMKICNIRENLITRPRVGITTEVKSPRVYKKFLHLVNFY